VFPESILEIEGLRSGTYRKLSVKTSPPYFAIPQRKDDTCVWALI
jgi:hypothetical protein